MFIKLQLTISIKHLVILFIINLYIRNNIFKTIRYLHQKFKSNKTNKMLNLKRWKNSLKNILNDIYALIDLALWEFIQAHSFWKFCLMSRSIKSSFKMTKCEILLVISTIHKAITTFTY